METIIPMREYTTGEARDNFAEVINETVFGNERVVLTRHGKKIAAIVPLSDFELLTELERLIDIEAARQAIAEGKTDGFTSLEDLKKEFGF
jgi:prevent-host-death family protein